MVSNQDFQTTQATIKSLVDNVTNFKSEALLPLFEAVVNAVQAIEDRGNYRDKLITIKILRASEQYLEFEKFPKEIPPINGFIIEDNGIGFNDVCFEAFKTYGTNYKMLRGCKGIGRYTWLKAFDNIEVKSVFTKNGKRFLREFSFSINNGVKEKFPPKETLEKQGTSIKLSKFKKLYRDDPSAYRQAKTIGQRILEHTLSYFIAKKSPEIIIEDIESGDEKVCLSDLFNDIKDNIEKKNFCINGISFKMYHIMLYNTHIKAHSLVICADDRDVIKVPFNKSLGSEYLFDENHNKFVYSAYLSSSYLNSKVNPDRISFDIPDEPVETAREDYPISLKEIKDKVLSKSKEFLSNYLQFIEIEKQKKISQFVTNNPWFKGVLHYCSEISDEIELNTSEDRMQELFYKFKGKAELAIIKQHKKLLRTQSKSFEEMEEEYNSTKEKIEVLGKDTLAEYVLYRKMIIELLDRKLNICDDGKYSKEDVIHDIFFPRYANSEQIRFADHNLWLLDERLAYHDYAKSELFLENEQGNSDRADIVVFSQIDPSDRTANVISIIELKKPNRKNFELDPTSQVYNYIEMIQAEKMKLENGRVIRVNDKTRYYGYIICEVNDKIRTYAKRQRFTELKNEYGFYAYNDDYRAHIEIVNFDTIVNDASMRHKAFFEKLGLNFL